MQMLSDAKEVRGRITGEINNKYSRFGMHLAAHCLLIIVSEMMKSVPCTGGEEQSHFMVIT